MDLMEKIVSLCRRRGFIFQSSEIYGGINGFWDYGPLGVELKNNIKQAWWHDMVRNPPPGPDGQEICMVGLDCSIIMNPKVWVASGHAKGFQDSMVACKAEGCRKLYRADKVWFCAFFDAEEVNQITAMQAEAVLGSDSWRNNEIEFFKMMARLQSPLPPKELIAVEADVREDAISKAQLSNSQRRRFQGDPKLFCYRLFDTSAINMPMNRCPNCQNDTLGEPRQFNLMFQTIIGAVQSDDNLAYLRPETAQGIFVNFKNVLDSSRVKLPFGVAQIGKAFRNEINPRNFTFRSREFEQMEIEFFCRPDESMKWYQYWRDVRKNWYTKLGIKSERLRPREQGKEELAHYSVGTTDIEYLFPFSDEPQELEGVAHRADYDLKQHQEHSGKDMTYFEDQLWAQADKSIYGGDKKKEQEAKSKLPYRYLPHVIEPSAGVDRFTLAVICEAYTEDKAPDAQGKEEERIVMKFHPRLAPVKAAILPLVNKEGMPEIAEKLYRELKADWNVQYDDGGAIGRRYRRQDEIGTPFCITVDGQTLQDQTVTIRDRDTLQQRRIKLDAVAGELRQALKAK